VKPYAFQLEIAAAVLRGEDVIVDVGTGSGKTLCVLPEQPFCQLRPTIEGARGPMVQ
jgi:hypothetical protein